MSEKPGHDYEYTLAMRAITREQFLDLNQRSAQLRSRARAAVAMSRRIRALNTARQDERARTQRRS